MDKLNAVVKFLQILLLLSTLFLIPAALFFAYKQYVLPKQNPGSNTVEEQLKDTQYQVFMFDKDKFNTPNNTNYVSAVTRVTNKPTPYEFLAQEIINGPTQEEITSKHLDVTFGDQSKGFAYFVGNSNCSGKDINIIKSDENLAISFCRETILSGDMSGSIVEQEFKNTFKQFSDIRYITILNNKNQCFNDMRGNKTLEECKIDLTK